ncbi:MAG: hypothetical protein ACD_16C00096G0002 [uncultured bacterium]|nr:MAG: hypothetical protein ACD_16C00096G0002 [uncultured bacterium]OFW91589.1 MAG: hypothetical protein A2W46_01050 [Alphaproteobacteria bacterium RIFCSPHIGHO2_12_42_13]HBG35142.1 hypothetical protein [Holosporales bacterium]HBW25024.1 hypothetical protein [Holosporales bacterium]HCC25110.1 hypothetical protein [Holosporales bacterium]
MKFKKTVLTMTCAVIFSTPCLSIGDQELIDLLDARIAGGIAAAKKKEMEIPALKQRAGNISSVLSIAGPLFDFFVGNPKLTKVIALAEEASRTTEAALVLTEALTKASDDPAATTALRLVNGGTKMGAVREASKIIADRGQEEKCNEQLRTLDKKLKEEEMSLEKRREFEKKINGLEKKTIEINRDSRAHKRKLLGLQLVDDVTQEVLDQKGEGIVIGITKRSAPTILAYLFDAYRNNKPEKLYPSYKE